MRGNVLTLKSKVCRFKPSWGRWIFSGRKNPEHKSSGRDLMMKRFGFRVVPVHPRHDGRHKQWPRLQEHHNQWWRGQGLRVWTGKKSFCHFPCNENPTRALKTSLQCCLSWTDAIDRREKIHICVWRFEVTSCKSASLKSTRFSQKRRRILF